ncbi:hypothetical protein D3105_28040, partial [Streptomyces globisporus]
GVGSTRGATERTGEAVRMGKPFREAGPCRGSEEGGAGEWRRPASAKVKRSVVPFTIRSAVPLCQRLTARWARRGVCGGCRR